MVFNAWTHQYPSGHRDPLNIHIGHQKASKPPVTQANNFVTLGQKGLLPAVTTYNNIQSWANVGKWAQQKGAVQLPRELYSCQDTLRKSLLTNGIVSKESIYPWQADRLVSRSRQHVFAGQHWNIRWLCTPLDMMKWRAIPICRKTTSRSQGAVAFPCTQQSPAEKGEGESLKVRMK